MVSNTRKPLGQALVEVPGLGEIERHERHRVVNVRCVDGERQQIDVLALALELPNIDAAKYIYTPERIHTQTHTHTHIRRWDWSSSEYSRERRAQRVLEVVEGTIAVVVENLEKRVIERHALGELFSLFLTLLELDEQRGLAAVTVAQKHQMRAR